MSESGSAPQEPSGNGGQGGGAPESNYAEPFEWKADPDVAKQEYIREWIVSILRDNVQGDDLQDSYSDLVPPETLFSREALREHNSPKMYKEIRDLIINQSGAIEKRRGLRIKKVLAGFYHDHQMTKDAIDLCREDVEAGIPALTLNRERSRSQENAARNSQDDESEGYFPPNAADQPRSPPVTRSTSQQEMRQVSVLFPIIPEDKTKAVTLRVHMKIRRKEHPQGVSTQIKKRQQTSLTS